MSSGKDPYGLDWEAIWRTLNWDDEYRQEAIEAERLRQRATQYAEPARQRDASAEEGKTYLAFQLGREQYAVDVLSVRGVRAAASIARVPGVPAFYRGVINVRGQIVTVMDLRPFFGIAAEDEIVAPRELVLARANRLDIGLLAHEIKGVVRLLPSKIKPLEHMPYTVGVTSDQVTVLNINQLFEDNRLIVTGRG
jgi:purine-binding chemotaxis protein CheW